ncbi:ferredoxin [Gellertiella hungarica]|uniref:Ferredoxin n=1 Tax=Gellertiella hungarica TaxID=1572859 RepID=A0A7W6NMZ0_9HYPH|nr:hypothetical protein [Gellertiella hungarica]
MSGPGTLRTIRAALEPHGLHLSGSISFEGDGPLLPDGRAARAVVLIGNAGGSLWPSFSAWRASRPDNGGTDPLDEWSKAMLRPVAQGAGATAFFPSDPPWQPFQQWAMRAEGLKPSPLGILIHPVYGLWHGYRGAFAFPDVPDDFAPTGRAGDHPCEACPDRPCLSSCPAAAIRREGFDYVACRTFLGGAEGRTCLEAGCVARNACPVGGAFRYPAEQIRFHMAALKRL